MLLQLKDKLQKNIENVVTINFIIRKQIKLLGCKVMCQKSYNIIYKSKSGLNVKIRC